MSILSVIFRICLTIPVLGAVVALIKYFIVDPWDEDAVAIFGVSCIPLALYLVIGLIVVIFKTIWTAGTGG